MRMTREAYAREVWKIVETAHNGNEEIRCPHEGCDKQLKILLRSIRAGTTFVCPNHGVIFRE